MKNVWKVAIVVLLAVAVVVAAVNLKGGKREAPEPKTAIKIKPTPSVKAPPVAKPSVQPIQPKPAPIAKQQPAAEKKTVVAAKPATPVKKPEAKKPKELPMLVDFGADRCMPCQMMAPVLEELAKEYQGKLDVVVIDVDKDQKAGSIYKIDLIPTQIFYDTDGKEVFRHEGFYSKEDILAKFKELGIEL
ncbi:MAG: thioredoxin domain-containing protein [Armatimonadota bacterium]|nr:thioredoxin domain-containing protein [Armatimonadota bacterium]